MRITVAWRQFPFLVVKNPRSRFLVEIGREKRGSSWRENERNEREEERNGREMREEKEGKREIVWDVGWVRYIGFGESVMTNGPFLFSFRFG